MSNLYVAAFGVGTTVALLLILRIAQRLISPKHTVSGDLASKNGAFRLLQVGDVLAVFLVAASVVKNCVTGDDLKADLFWVACFGIGGIAVVEMVGHLTARTLLKGRLFAELERGNTAAGLAGASHVVATGILASRAAAGDDMKGVGLALVFFTLALVAHMILVALFRALTTYDDAEQIQGENLAAALSYSGLTIAVALLVARGVEGDFVSWAESLAGFGGVVACALALYPLRQLVVQGLLLGAAPSLRGGALDQAIAVERNEGMGALEAVTYVATALAIVGLA